jgi:YVTN family beta-propeller protein
MKTASLFLAAAILFASCKPEERVIGASEIGWQFLAATDASLKLVEQPGTKIIQDDAYFSANGTAFPAVTKIAEYHSKLYLLKKDTAQIEVLDKATFKKVGEINFTAIPSDITFANATTAYVAHADANSVSVVDITVNQIARTLNVGKNPVAIAAVGNQVFVANRDDNTLSVINTPDNSLRAAVSVPVAPIALEAHEAQNEVAVLSLGAGKLQNSDEPKSPARVTFIDAATRATINSVSVFETAKDSLIGEPIDFALAQGSYPYAFVTFKKTLVRVDAKRHNAARIVKTGTYSGISYNFKRNELLFTNPEGASTQISTGDPSSGDKRTTFTLPFGATYILPF